MAATAIDLQPYASLDDGDREPRIDPQHLPGCRKTSPGATR